MYYAMRASAPSLHRESTDSLICNCFVCKNDSNKASSLVQCGTK